jgi:hypothetical protein
VNVSEVFIRPPLQHASTDLDPMTLEPIKDLGEDGKVILNLGGSKVETFSKDYLLSEIADFTFDFYITSSTEADCVTGWITSQVLEGKDVTDITVCTLTRNQRPKEVLLTDDVWMTSLLRGPWKEEFQQIWETRKRITVQRNSALEELNAIPGFADRTKMFIRDLRCFGQDQEAQNRLNDTKHEYYLGGVYFNNSTVKKILGLPVGNGTLKSELEKLSKRKMDRGEGEELCASHDLSPLYEVALGLDWKKLKNDDLLRDMSSLGLGQKKKSAASNMRQGLIKKASTIFGKKDGITKN